MLPEASIILRTSRPRFWLYLGGTYLLGYALGATGAEAFLVPAFWFHLAYFLIVSNILLYGVNDLSDRDTDAANPKKGAQEHLLRDTQQSLIRQTVYAAVAVTLAVALLNDPPARVFVLGFLFLAVTYSVPPFRFKARPLLDSGSNILYAFPGFIGYHQASGRLPSWPIVLAAASWTASMHLLSAVPDIEADRRAGLTTSAVRLGARLSLALCMVLWAGFAIILFTYKLLWPWSILALVYPAVAAALLMRPEWTSRVYWWFPWINGSLGCAAVLAVLKDRIA